MERQTGMIDISGPMALMYRFSLIIPELMELIPPFSSEKLLAGKILSLCLIRGRNALNGRQGIFHSMVIGKLVLGGKLNFNGCMLRLF
jgi:hypothetical protein